MPNGIGRPYYQAVIEMEDRIPPAPENENVEIPGLQPFKLSVDESYLNWLFHGPCFRGIRDITGISDKGIVGTLHSVPPARCLKGMDNEKHWLFDPVVLDSSLQLVILWERTYHDMTPLPVQIGRYRRFGSLSDAPVHCYLQVKTLHQGQLLYADIYYVNKENQVVGVLEGLECSCSNKLNRLAGISH